MGYMYTCIYARSSHGSFSAEKPKQVTIMENQMDKNMNITCVGSDM